MDICIDFDGTCVTHEYPQIGAEIGAAPVLKELVEKGHRLIIFTMRSGDKLREAYDWFGVHEIPVYGIQSNPTQVLWTQSPKAYGQLYIDDAGLGIPLSQETLDVKGVDDMMFGKMTGKYTPKREYVDWVKVRELLKEKGIL